MEGSAFQNLKALVFGKSNLPPEKLQVISSVFPDLYSLELRGSTLSVPHSFCNNSFGSIVKLNLSYCKISNFQDLSVLGVYENLSELKLCNNPISKLEFPSGFARLRKINIEGTKVSDLVSFYSLNFFPALTEIRAGNTPLAERLKDHLRKVLIAYLHKATKVNGGYVDPKERTLHERQFVRDFSDPSNPKEYASCAEYILSLVGFSIEPEETEVNAAVFQVHSKTYGTVHKFAEVSLAPPTTANLIFETEDGRKEVKEVPLGWKVSNLKKLCQGLFGIPQTLQKLYYLDAEVPMYGMELLRFDNKELRHLKMKDNDVITVRVKD